MKMKILVVPFVIVIAIIFFVWLIYPAYSNGTDGVRENYAQLKSEQEKLDDIRMKNQNIKSLSDQVVSLSEKDVLYSFLPESAKEEEILNSLSRLASESGLLLFDATVEQPVEPKANALSLGSSEDAKEMNKPKIKNFSTEMRLTGNYGAIRSFFGKLGSFSRNNEVVSLEIEKNVSKDEAVSASGGLIVSASANFNFLTKPKLSEESVSSDVFSSSKLDTKIIENIKDQKSVAGYQLSVGQKGRNNLFQ